MKNIKLKELLNESLIGFWGMATPKAVNKIQSLTENPGAPGIMPTKTAPAAPTSSAPRTTAPTKPSVQPVKTTQPTNQPSNQSTPEENNDVPEDNTSIDTGLNFKVSPGYKVEFEGKPGSFYIIRIMNSSMTNFLVVNDKIGKPFQLYNVKVSKIDSTEKGKPYKGE